jgi:hypothetical protein
MARTFIQRAGSKTTAFSVCKQGKHLAYGSAAHDSNEDIGVFLLEMLLAGRRMSVQ